MDQRIIPINGKNPYADHPGFDLQGCFLQYTVTQTGAFGGVRGGFGCEVTGGHCLKDEHCDNRRKEAKEQDKFRALVMKGQPCE